MLDLLPSPSRGFGKGGQMPAVHRDNAVPHELTRGPDDEARRAVGPRGTVPLLAGMIGNCFSHGVTKRISVAPSWLTRGVRAKGVLWARAPQRSQERVKTRRTP